MRASAKLFFASALSLAAAVAAAQGAQPGVPRGSVPPGSIDGAKPSDGAIQGGSILPGESAGQPAGRGATTPGGPPPEERCRELTGTLREQCMLDAQRPSGGAGRAVPPATRGAPPPPADPPPQRPR